MPVIRITRNLHLDRISACAGSVQNVPEDLAADLVGNGVAEYTDPPKPKKPFIPAAERETAPLDFEEAIAAAEDDEETPGLPKPYAPKQDWVNYAVAVDDKLDPEVASRMTKADLMSRYGDRL